jgi:hypothetical protein
MDRVQNVATPAVDTTGARRSLAAIWRTFVKASAFEAEEGRVIAMAWCCPWLYMPVMRLGNRRSEQPDRWPPCNRVHDNRGEQ